ncbi:hypothetical protein [Mesorhizobium ventifaucium]|uniref:hypothetical protein n=1 Tax=Mesorhizobium ventifaucium TaxID=666020 RepID=UPI0020A6EBDC|nr:hypothetical protein [Mesorhizobium ventifaucium]
MRSLGVSDLGKTQEFTQSLGEYDRDRAGEVYRKRLAVWDLKLGAWAALLEHGPRGLTQKQRFALAGEYAKAFLAAHEEEPFYAPPSLPAPEARADDGGVLARAVASMAPGDRAELRGALLAYFRAGDHERVRLALSLFIKFPALQESLGPDFVAALEGMHGAEADAALAARGLLVTEEARRLLTFDMADMMGAARRGLVARSGGDYRPVPELEGAPGFVLESTPVAAAPGPVVTFAAIIDAQATKRGAGQGSKSMPDKSVKKYKRIADAFARHRGSSNAATVTVLEVEAWLDSMQAEAEVSNRTIADRLVNLGTIINWGKRLREYREAMAAAETISGKVELPSYMEKPGGETAYRLEEARTVLKAARSETDPSKRWLPWLCLYAGLRISEANTLRKADFFEAEGSWFLKVTSAGKRSLKTASSERRIPVHPALEAEGFLEWVRAAPSGQLFRDGATSLIGRWVKGKVVGLVRLGVAPNHGLRHLFVDLCRRYGVEDSAREYMAGHSSPSVHTKYGSSDAMLPGLAAEMLKVVPVLPTPTNSAR